MSSPRPKTPESQSGSANLLSAARGFYSLCVRKPVALLVLFATLIVIGGISYQRIPLQMMPDGMDEPGLWVEVVHPGSSAAENERKVARVLEEQFRTLQGIERVRSRSSDGEVGFDVTYRADVDMDICKAELRDRIERARPLLPDSVDRIFVWSWSNDQMPIMWLAVTNSVEDERTDFLVDTVIKRQVEAVDGVSNMAMWGLLDDSIRILLDEDQIVAANLDIGTLVRRLASDNFAEPLGDVEDGGRKFLLRSDMRFGSLEEIENYPVGNGMRLKDVGRVIRAKSVRDRLSRIDGNYAYFGSIRKESQANVVETAEKLRTALAKIEENPDLEGRFKFVVFFDQGEFIQSSLSQLKSTALWGGGLAVVILLLFLRRVRLTLCVALSIPVSALLSIAWTYFTGGSFNVLTMTGITLGVGMLVDNAVVVIENIARLRSEGADPRTAAIVGAREVGLPVALATLTSVVVFMPMIFMTENPIMRIIFGSIGIPLCMSLLFSLLVALVFLPVIAARLVGPRSPAAESFAAFLAPIASLPARLTGYAVAAVRATIHAIAVALHTVEVAALSVLAPLRWLLAAGVLGFVAWRAWPLLQGSGRPATASLSDLDLAPSSFGQAADRTQNLIALASPALLVVALLLFGVTRWRKRPAKPPLRPSNLVPAGSSIIEFVEQANRGFVTWTLRHRIAAFALALIGLFSIYVPMNQLEVAAFGEDGNRGRIDLSVELEDDFTLAQASAEIRIYEDWLASKKEEVEFDHLSCRFDSDSGRLTLYWDEPQDEKHMKMSRELLRDTQPKIAGHKVYFRDQDAAAELKRDQVVFKLEGPDAEKLADLAELAKARLSDVPGLSGVSTPIENAPPQVRVQIDDEIAYDYGVTADVALENISWALRGQPLPRYQEEGREVPFYIEFDEEKVAGLDTLRDLRVWTGDGAVPLSSFATLDFARGARSIRRQDGKTTLSITAQVDDPSRQAKMYEDGLEALQELELPRGYAIADSDSVVQRRDEEMGELVNAMLFAVVLVFVVMCILFESFTLPFAVLTIVPFAIVGAYWALFLASQVSSIRMDSVGWIGIIILVGVVVNNGIVLIDRIHRLARSGMNRDQAVVDGAAHRVRPILMTALTTICGLLPMAFSDPPSEGIDYRALATCVAGGLFFSTFFTLSVVPLAYVLISDGVDAFTRAIRWDVKRATRVEAPAPTPELAGVPWRWSADSDKSDS